MAILSRDQQLKLIKTPKYQKELLRARRKRERTALHAETETEDNIAILKGTHHARFLEWVRAVLQSDENYDRFLSLYRPPVPTNELVDAIYDEFTRVFEGQNAFEKFNFQEPELAQDFTRYRERLQDYKFWQTKGFDTLKTGVDNILVVDMPRMMADQAAGDTRPQPYYYILDICNVIDIDNDTRVLAEDEEGNEFYYFKTEYIIFREEIDEVKYIFCFDDEKFTRFQEIEGQETPRWIEDVPHTLGYCPARSFWTEPLNSRSSIMKKDPITGKLSDLDWLLFFSIAERYLQLYAPFPIYALYKGRCDYKEQEGLQRRCVDGWLEVEGQRSIGHDRQRCPKCANKIKVGPGNVMYFNVPKESTDPDLMANPMKVIPAERTSLDYVRATVKEMKQDIFVSCVGRSQDPQNNQAKNELQVESGFESSEAILLKIKRNFEAIKLFALDTVARLRYGSQYLGGVINLGDKFFVKDEGKELDSYQQAIEAKLPAYELALRRDDINEARYRNNPVMRERLVILRNLEPFPDMNIETLKDMRKDMPELVSMRDMVVKLNFNSFIDRFEREQAGLALFASSLEFARKITLIREELYKYADEYIALVMPAGTQGNGAGLPGGDSIPTPIDKEAEAKANLKGSVGGVQGLLSVQAAVAAGTTNYDAAVAVLIEIYGFDDAKARAILGPARQAAPPVA